MDITIIRGYLHESKNLSTVLHMNSILSFSLFLMTVQFSFSQTPAPGKQNPVLYRETARLEDKIQKTFSYDIKLKNADGKEFVSSSLFKQNGKPTVLLFWLTTCGPCKMEMEAIKNKYESWSKESKFNFFAISTDWSHNTEKFVERVKTFGWPFAAYHDFNQEFKYVMPGGLNGLPQVFVLNKKGEVVFHKRKYMPGDEDKLFEEIKKL